MFVKCIYKHGVLPLLKIKRFMQIKKYYYIYTNYFQVW